MNQSIVIVGGGPAGYFAAIHAAEKHPEASVLILEASGRPLSKVLISGGGRCNVTHDARDARVLLANYPRGHRELPGPFSRFSVADTIEWFESSGVKLKTEEDGRMFPVSNQARSITQCLIQAAAQAGVRTELNKPVVSIKKDSARFVLNCKGAKSVSADVVILTTGGKKSSFELPRSLGHTVIRLVPSLFTFKISDPLIEGLSGISFPEVNLTLGVSDKVFTQSGPLLITHWGLSGPAVIKLSAFAAPELFDASYQAKLTVSFLPASNAENVFEKLRNLKQDNAKKQMSSLAPFELPNRLWNRVLEIATIPETLRYADCSKSALRQIAQMLAAKEFSVSGKGVFKEEFVTCGGVDPREVDLKTMQSKLVDGLYFAGEILNFDGITGGFNFQNAWTTGWIAGASC